MRPRNNMLDVMPPPFPLAMGNEEETGLQFFVNGYDGPVEISDFPNKFFETYVNHADKPYVFSEFITNGFRIYAGGGIGENGSVETNPERATPETRTPSELVKYILAGEAYIIEMVSRYISRNNGKLTQEEYGGFPFIRGARMQRRAVDSQLVSKGTHDNFDLSRVPYEEVCAGGIDPVIAAHCFTRPFVSGAGLVLPASFAFSQKMFNVEQLTGVNMSNGTTLFAVKDDDRRLEIRSSDPNILQWATWMRVGSAALVVAMAGTPLLKPMQDLQEKYVPDIPNVDPRLIAPRYNLMGSVEMSNAVAFQRELATLALDKLQLYADDSSIYLGGIPDEYYKIAKEWLEYVDDFELYTKSEIELSDLADRSDWARKLDSIRRNVDSEKRKGLRDRTENDMRAQAGDMLYDMVRFDVDPDNATQVNITKGAGYINRDRETRPLQASPYEVIEAQRSPPPTRSELRVKLMEGLQELDGSMMTWHWWQSIAISNMGRRYTIKLPIDPTQTVLDPEEQLKLDSFIQYMKSDDAERTFMYWDELDQGDQILGVMLAASENQNGGRLPRTELAQLLADVGDQVQAGLTAGQIQQILSDFDELELD